MNALLLLTLACFFALFVLALAVARHVRIERIDLAREEEDASDRTAPLARRAFTPPRRTEQRLRSLVEHKQPDWRFLTSGTKTPGRTQAARNVTPFTRKPPVSVRPDPVRRADWVYFNQDLGDLRDPYQTPESLPRPRAANAARR